MNLTDIRKEKLPRKYKTRVGRGVGSGSGRRAGRGHRGQLARSGVSFHAYFEGGQMPLARKLAKRGFNNKSFQVAKIIVNLTKIESSFDDGSNVTPADLEARRLITGVYDQVKVLANKELKKKLNVSAHEFSAKAKEYIEKAGGKAILIKQEKVVPKRITLSSIFSAFADKETVDTKSLVEKKLLKSSGDLFKIVSVGTSGKKKLSFRIPSKCISSEAITKIKKLGSDITFAS